MPQFVVFYFQLPVYRNCAGDESVHMGPHHTWYPIVRSNSSLLTRVLLEIACLSVVRHLPGDGSLAWLGGCVGAINGGCATDGRRCFHRGAHKRYGCDSGRSSEGETKLGLRCMRGVFKAFRVFFLGMLRRTWSRLRRKDIVFEPYSKACTQGRSTNTPPATCVPVASSLAVSPDRSDAPMRRFFLRVASLPQPRFTVAGQYILFLFILNASSHSSS